MNALGSKPRRKPLCNDRQLCDAEGLPRKTKQWTHLQRPAQAVTLQWQRVLQAEATKSLPIVGRAAQGLASSFMDSLHGLSATDEDGHDEGGGGQQRILRHSLTCEVAMKIELHRVLLCHGLQPGPVQRGSSTAKNTLGRMPHSHSVALSCRTACGAFQKNMDDLEKPKHGDACDRPIGAMCYQIKQKEEEC